MKYVNYDKDTSKILGYYDPQINGKWVEPQYDEKGNLIKEGYLDLSAIPQPNIEITDEQWQEAINNNYNYVDASTKALSQKDFRTSQQIFDDTKTSLLHKLKYDFNNLPNLGYQSQTINKKINARYTDLQNMQSLLTYMQLKNITSTQFRCYDNSFVTATQDQLKSMIDELIAYGLECYQKKWVIEQK